MKKLMNFAASLLLSLSLMAAGCGQSKEAASRKSAPAAAPRRHPKGISGTNLL